jgi:hypothetical protein
MRLHLSFKTFGLIGLILALGLLEAVSMQSCWAQEKGAAGAAQGAPWMLLPPRGPWMPSRPL